MIEDISAAKDVVKEEQVNICDICNNEINTIKYLNVTTSNIKKVQGISNGEEKNNKNNNDNGEYYNICLNCADKIVELMRYNFGFEGRLIQFLESLKTEK
ncbi:MAG TPA: hypothetical protein VLA48_02170 [Nitrososphaeraceae archaeon]|jgi:hypothetical protein|nr:hypothetical protein [Nitrososphaeraceae archaeon]